MITTAILLPVQLNGNYLLQDKLNRTFKCLREDDADEFIRVNARRSNAVKVTEVNNKLVYRACNADFYKNADPVDESWKMMMETITNAVPTEVMTDERKEVIKFLNNAFNMKPERLKMQPIKWKYLVRSVLRAKNIMMAGTTGCGKTTAVQCLSIAFPDRKLFTFNLGNTDDPRSALIGNTHFSKESGTYFAESVFVKAIQTENAIILMDELTRAHPSAWNILMPILDETQRFLRLDDADGTPTIKVAKGVSFIATANIGNEYTATRVLDRALLDRFTIIEMDVLGIEDEKSLLKSLYPELNDKKIAAIAEIADATRKEVKSESSKIDTIISTRATVELAGLLNDGFTLAEAADIAIFPFFPDEGGVDSSRTYIKQIVQRHLDVDNAQYPLFNMGTGDAATNAKLSNAKPF